MTGPDVVYESWRHPGGAGDGAMKCPRFADQSMEAPGALPVRARVPYEESVERSGGAENGALTYWSDRT